MHILRVLIILYKSYSVTTLKLPKPVSLENYARIVGYSLHLRVVYFQNVREFLLHSFIIKLVLLLIPIGESYLPYVALLFSWKLLSALWLL
jgi:hypothetical protein